MTIVRWIEGVSRSWSVSKVEGVLAAVAYAHRLAGYDPPPTGHALVHDALTSMKRLRGTSHVQKDPLLPEELHAMLEHVDRATLAGARDAAILLVGWAAALRRSEIVALRVDDVKPAPGGLAIRIRRSKTDQAGEGYTIGIEEKGTELCPVGALREWLAISEITEGPIFRGLTRAGTVRARALTDQVVAKIVKRLALAAGLDPAHFSGHSIRAGHVTEAYRQDVPEAQIMATTRHKSIAMLARYRREADPVKRGSTSRMKF